MTKSPRGKPLSGVRILVGRARRQASALSAGLKALGAEVIEIPFIEIRSPKTYKPLDSALKRIHEYEWLILTSVNGAEALGQRLMHLQIKPHTLAHLRIVAIGPATRDAITRLGLKVAVVPDHRRVGGRKLTAPSERKARVGGPSKSSPRRDSSGTAEDRCAGGRGGSLRNRRAAIVEKATAGSNE